MILKRKRIKVLYDNEDEFKQIEIKLVLYQAYLINNSLKIKA